MDFFLTSSCEISRSRVPYLVNPVRAKGEVDFRSWAQIKNSKRVGSSSASHPSRLPRCSSQFSRNLIMSKFRWEIGKCNWFDCVTDFFSLRSRITTDVAGRWWISEFFSRTSMASYRIPPAEKKGNSSNIFALVLFPYFRFALSRTSPMFGFFSTQLYIPSHANQLFHLCFFLFLLLRALFLSRVPEPWLSLLGLFQSARRLCLCVCVWLFFSSLDRSSFIAGRDVLELLTLTDINAVREESWIKKEKRNQVPVMR